MRPIKFRAWNNELGTMADNDNLKGALGGLLLAVRTGGEEFTFMQYTGLKDKNGKEIYEGDIVRFNDFAYDRTGGNVADTIRRCEVKYLYDGFFAEDVTDDEYVEQLYTAMINDEEIEVIGNIYENPELLEAHHE